MACGVKEGWYVGVSCGISYNHISWTSQAIEREISMTMTVRISARRSKKVGSGRRCLGSAARIPGRNTSL